jgi:mono/diheme cytochrome c family protein
MNRFAAIGMIGAAALVMITACKRAAEREATQSAPPPSAPPASSPGPQPTGMTGGGGMPMKPARKMPAAADTAAAPVAAAPVAAAPVAAAPVAAAPVATPRVASAGECPPGSKELVDRGRKIFTGTGNCYACHGSDAHGTAVAPNLTDATWLNIDGSYAGIAGLVRSGVPQPKHFPTPMPAGGGAQLDQGQLCAVAAYVYSLSH